MEKLDPTAPYHHKGLYLCFSQLTDYISNQHAPPTPRHVLRNAAKARDGRVQLLHPSPLYTDNILTIGPISERPWSPQSGTHPDLDTCPDMRISGYTHHRTALPKATSCCGAVYTAQPTLRRSFYPSLGYGVPSVQKEQSRRCYCRQNTVPLSNEKLWNLKPLSAIKNQRTS